MTPAQEKDFALRGKRAHERRYGQSTWIESRYMADVRRVRVSDHELGIVTYWQLSSGRHPRIRFMSQIGEPR